MGFTVQEQQAVLPGRYHVQTTLFEKGESLVWVPIILSYYDYSVI
jgi:hypothetical protein